MNLMERTKLSMSKDITIEVWGDLACFTRPECKVERLSYPIPTPSAARGILGAIYSKPPEFYWQVTKIEILKPIQTISFMRNEVKNKIGCGKIPEVIFVDDTRATCGSDQKGRTQRLTTALKDVRYRITGHIVRQPGCITNDEGLYQQAIRRIKNGQCFYQPSLGIREFICYYELSDGKTPPVNENIDLGYMLYDVFDLHDFAVHKKAKPYITLFRANIKNGVMVVPDFDSDEVLRPEGSENA